MLDRRLTPTCCAPKRAASCRPFIGLGPTYGDLHYGGSPSVCYAFSHVSFDFPSDFNIQPTEFGF